MCSVSEKVLKVFKKFAFETLPIKHDYMFLFHSVLVFAFCWSVSKFFCLENIISKVVCLFDASLS